MKPVIDRHTSGLRRKDYIAYRGPELLDETLPEPTEIWRGTVPVPGR